MKKPKISNGPWALTKSGQLVLCENGGHVAVITDKPIFASDPLPCEGRANARAIAAVPDLLAALENALDRINAANDHQRKAARMEYGTQDIMDALTKAGYEF